MLEKAGKFIGNECAQFPKYKNESKNGGNPVKKDLYIRKQKKNKGCRKEIYQKAQKFEVVVINLLLIIIKK